jgi:exosortase
MKASSAIKDRPGGTKEAPARQDQAEGTSRRHAGRLAALVAVVSGAFLLWAFWPSLVELAEVWESDPQYSHGFLVPAFSLVLLWLRRDQLRKTELRPSYWGLLILAAGCAVRLAGGYYYYFWPERIAFLPVLVGLVVTLGGWGLLRYSWPAIGFLVFMFPLPSGLATALGNPLQRIGTLASSYLLEVLGIPAVTEGNIILLRDVDLGVIEACSGLRMLITFFAASAAVALLVKQPLWVRIPLFLSAAPIAVLVNVLRITVTGLLHETVGTRIANLVFHDLAGWLMMPAALALLWLVNLFLCRAVHADPEGVETIEQSLKPAGLPARPSAGGSRGEADNAKARVPVAKPTVTGRPK